MLCPMTSNPATPPGPARHALEGLALLTGVPVGEAGPADGTLAYPPDTLLGRAEATLHAYRRAMHRAGNPKAWRRRG